jgi:hypothetical protein
MSANPLNDIFILFDKGKLKEQNEEQLQCLYITCTNCQGSDVFSRTKAENVTKAILAQLVRLQNDRLVEQVGKLTQVADAQKQLAQEAGEQAKNLSKQTVTLVEETVKLTQFTRGVYCLTIVLGIFAFVQIVIMLIGLFSSNH